jgi:hypothetical protein
MSEIVYHKDGVTYFVPYLREQLKITKNGEPNARSNFLQSVVSVEIANSSSRIFKHERVNVKSIYLA